MKLMAYNHIETTEINDYLEDENWTLQQKVDGIRARLIVTKHTVEVLNSQGSTLQSTTAVELVASVHQRHSLRIRPPRNLLGGG